MNNGKNSNRTATLKTNDAWCWGGALNGYGRTVRYVVQLERLVRRCRACQRTEFDGLILDCNWHNRSNVEWELMADGEGLDLEEAIRKIERAIVSARTPGHDAQSIWRKSPLSRAASDHGSDRSLQAKDSHGAA
ncbi:MAG: hypothetical protein E6Q97_20020 [Desulfurellales bacterium]|nr:MAG: hypothetical protein E6Q97_20020 [Desulfurellales bacterium]